MSGLKKYLSYKIFSIEIRYPDHVIELSDEDIVTAIEIAVQFRKMILEKMGLDIAFDDFNYSSDS